MKASAGTATSKGLWRKAEAVKAAWRRGQSPDAAAALRESPALASCRSVVIDLAYEEFLLRERAGVAPDPAEFARHFPEFQASVQDLLEAHCLLMADPGLLAPPDEEWPEIGGTLEGLELRSELGRGTFGRAYLAFDPALDRLRVIKLAGGGAAEAKLIGGLNHPHVIDVLWTRPVGRRTAVCMPFVGATTLASLLERAQGRPLPAKDILEETHTGEQPDACAEPLVREGDSALVAACAVAAKLAGAIGYLHDRDISHGDVKPSNIVLEPGGSPRVIDFNLAAGVEPARAIRGTPSYMAPELLDATLAGRSPAAAGVDGKKLDLFALGVTIIELIGGKHPYRDRADGTLLSLASASRTFLVELPRELPSALAAQLQSCVAAEPENRPESAAALAEALDRFVQQKRTRTVRRKKLALAMCAAVAMLVAFAGLGWALAEQPAIERAPETGAEFRARGLASLHDGKPDAARADFVSAHQRSADPHDLALAAYCYALSGEQATAVEWSRKALAAGADTPAVRNNLAAALIKSSKFEEALAHLDIALGQETDLPAARYNRALARFQLALKPAGKDKLAGAVKDITAALAKGPVSDEMHLDAARIFALASPGDADLADRAIDQLEAAIKLGQAPARIVKDLVLKQHLEKNPRFARLTDLKPGDASAPAQLKLVEPAN